MKGHTIFLADGSKSILLKQINNSPGIRYRELQRATGFSNGVLAYHLKILEKSKRMKVIRYHVRNSTRYYPLNTTAKESLSHGVRSAYNNQENITILTQARSMYFQ